MTVTNEKNKLRERTSVYSLIPLKIPRMAKMKEFLLPFLNSSYFYPTDFHFLHPYFCVYFYVLWTFFMCVLSVLVCVFPVLEEGKESVRKKLVLAQEGNEIRYVVMRK